MKSPTSKEYNVISMENSSTKERKQRPNSESVVMNPAKTHADISNGVWRFNGQACRNLPWSRIFPCDKKNE
jgi:hypothetical protein